MTEPTTRAELQARLHAVARRLVARQLARAAFSGLAGGALLLAVGVLFLDLLPRLLFSATAGTLAMALAGACGFVLGVAWELRRYRLPSLQEAALTLEARLPQDTGALAAALRVVEDNAFYRPLLARAAIELKQAEEAPAPVLISTRRLVLVPLLALASGVAFAAVVSAEQPAGKPKLRESAGGDRPGSWSNVDVGGARSIADRQAYRKALGLKETAAKLNHSAATMRDSAASQDQVSTALNDAKKALEEGDATASGLKAGQLPQAAPAEPAQRAKLADRLDAAAASLKGAAAKIEKGKPAGSEDSGSDGQFNVNAKREDLVPLEALPAGESSPAQAVAAQTPARRAMAERAVKALENRQEK